MTTNPITNPSPATVDASKVIRKQQSTISPLLVRCVCITASFLVTGCALLGFGLTCVLLGVVDDKAAPCPFSVTVTSFSVAGGLLVLSFILFLNLCSRRNRLKREALLEEIPGNDDPAHYKKKLSIVEVEGAVVTPSDGVVCGDKSEQGLTPTAPPSNSQEVENFAMTQKSADVSYWIEQQKPEETTVEESFSLQPEDGDTKENTQDSDGEMTAL